MNSSQYELCAGRCDARPIITFPDTVSTPRRPNYIPLRDGGRYVGATCLEIIWSVMTMRWTCNLLIATLTSSSSFSCITSPQRLSLLIIKLEICSALCSLISQYCYFSHNCCYCCVSVLETQKTCCYCRRSFFFFLLNLTLCSLLFSGNSIFELKLLTQCAEWSQFMADYQVLVSLIWPKAPDTCSRNRRHKFRARFWHRFFVPMHDF